MAGVVIVGGGQAGVELATSLRKNDYTGSICIIGEEPCAPYHRPPLSKGYLGQSVGLDDIYLMPQMAYQQANIELITSVRVLSIDRDHKTLELSDGTSRRYEKLALTTGGRPRRLDVTDASAAENKSNFHYLRTLDDVTRLRRQFNKGLRLTIVGGGYIGLEVAAVAAAQGLQVTIVEALPRVLARVTGPEVSEFYQKFHEGNGVNVLTDVQVEGFDLDESVNAIVATRCSDGLRIVSDIVVAGVGLIPNTEIAADAGLAIENGIVVDAFARTQDEDIVAAGDCTNHPSKYRDERIRLESVGNAVEQARVAAATLMGRLTAYDAVPWFWSDQYDLKLQTVGLCRGYDELVVRGNVAAKSFAVFYLKEKRVIAVDAVNRTRDFLAAKRIVAGQLTIDAASLADESVELRALVTRV